MLPTLNLPVGRDHAPQTGSIYEKEEIMLYPKEIFDGAISEFWQFFVDRYGWKNGAKWTATYDQGGETRGVIEHDGNKKVGEEASIRIFRTLNGYNRRDIRTYTITIGDVGSVCKAFMKHATVLGEFADSLFNGPLSPFDRKSQPGPDQFRILQEIIEQAKLTTFTEVQRSALNSMQGFSYGCLRDVTSMLLKEHVPNENYECHLKSFDHWANRVSAIKDMMLTAKSSFYVVSAAEDLIAGDQLGLTFRLKRFVATTLNPKMLDVLKRFANVDDQPHTILAIKVKEGARFMPMLYYNFHMQEYEIVLDSGQTATCVKVQTDQDCSHYGGPSKCRVVWLEVG